MTTPGYPDYFRPRDYLAGLEGSQVYASWTFTAPSGSHTIYTVPADKTLVMRLIGNQVSAHCTAGAPGNGLARSIFQISNGLDGASGAVYIAWAEVILAPGQGDHDSVTVEETIAVKGGAAGNPIVVSNALTNLDSWDGICYFLGALLN